MEFTRSDLFDGLSPQESGEVLALGTRMQVTGGAELFRLGESADRLFLVTRGLVRLTLPMQVRGEEKEVQVEEVTPGQAVGWSALIPPYRYTLRATVPLETELVAISREALRELFCINPLVGSTVSLNVAAIVGKRLQLFQAMWLREMQRMVELQCL